MSRIGYNDDYSRAVFSAFKSALAPLMAQVAPDWVLHHIEMRRDSDRDTMEERVEIRLVIKPIGSARETDHETLPKLGLSP